MVDISAGDAMNKNATSPSDPPRPAVVRRGAPKRKLALFVHAGRIALVACLLLAIPSGRQTSVVDSGIPPSIELIQKILSGATRVGDTADTAQFWPVFDSADAVIGRVARTLPAAQSIVGYRGPTESAVVIDTDSKIVGVKILSSGDTVEHVAEVRNDAAFFAQFEGWEWNDVSASLAAQIDGVSGATLTSLALAEGLVKRMGGELPSLVFADPIMVDEAEQLLPGTTTVQSGTIPGVFRALAADGSQLGFLVRSGPLSDDIPGYQGPSELVFAFDSAIAFDLDTPIAGIKLRGSFDNQPYVDYVRQEYSFWPLFRDRTVRQLAAFDPQARNVEGVSGATMTSLAVADTIPAACRRLVTKFDNERLQRHDATIPLWQQVRWTPTDVATLITLLLAGVLSATGKFRTQRLRRVWLIGVVIVIGLWAGNLISMSLIAGWSAEGIPWRLAPGLTAILVVAALLPPLTKGNPYCNHICPHGGLQQILRPPTKSSRTGWPGRLTSRRRWRLPTKLHRIASWTPGLTLTLAYVMLTLSPTSDLSSWEPFHAYLFKIATASSIALAVGTLAISAFVPMAYCRYGCGTGRMLDYLRRTGASHKIDLADVIAICLLGLAIACRQF